jgi:ribosomal protein S18 acetylase RimI-like enzyme
MAPQVTIRQATLADVPQLAQIHVAAWQEAYRGIMPQTLLDGLTPARREPRWRQRLTEGADYVLVPERDGRVIGFAAFGPSRDDDTPPRTGEIYAIYLNPDVWREGIGRTLWRAATDQLAGEGQVGVIVWVLAENWPARRFYEAMGCQLDGARRDIEREGASLPELRYACPLGP